MTRETIGFTWYSEKLETPEVLKDLVVSLAETQVPPPNSFTVLDQNFEERIGKYNSENLLRTLDAADNAGLLGFEVFSLVKGEDNRFPRSSIAL